MAESSKKIVIHGEQGVSGLKTPQTLNNLTSESYKKWMQFFDIHSKVTNMLPSVSCFEDDKNCYRKELYTKQKKQRYYYNKHARTLPVLEKGKAVKIKDERSSGPHKGGLVVGHGQGPRSYLIKTEEGGIVQRNRKDFIRNGQYSENYRFYDEVLPDKATVDDNEVPNINGNIVDITSDSHINSYRTRAGREVRRPAYLLDYC